MIVDGERRISGANLSKCIAELRHKAKLFHESQLVEALDGIYKSDTIVPESLRQALLKAVAPLENVPSKYKDWHPGSDEKVLDLVHPSLFPLVYGQSKILPDSTVDLQNCVSRCGEGHVIPVPSREEVIDVKPYRWGGTMDDNSASPWSQKFQWLPTEFELPPGSDDVR